MAKIVGVSKPNKNGYVTFYFCGKRDDVDGMLAGSFQRREGFINGLTGKPLINGDEIPMRSAFDRNRKVLEFYPSFGSDL